MNRLEALVWVLGILTFGSVLLSPVACTVHRHYRISQTIVESNQSPMEIKCAIEGDSMGRPACIALAVGKSARKEDSNEQ